MVCLAFVLLCQLLLGNLDNLVILTFCNDSFLFVLVPPASYLPLLTNLSRFLETEYSTIHKGDHHMYFP